MTKSEMKPRSSFSLISSLTPLKPLRKTYGKRVFSLVFIYLVVMKLALLLINLWAKIGVISINTALPPD